MSEWVKCTGANNPGIAVFVTLATVLAMTEYGSGTRLALSGNSQTYVDVLETPEELLSLPRVGNELDSSANAQFQRRDQGLFEAPM